MIHYFCIHLLIVSINYTKHQKVSNILSSFTMAYIELLCTILCHTQNISMSYIEYSVIHTTGHQSFCQIKISRSSRSGHILPDRQRNAGYIGSSRHLSISLYRNKIFFIVLLLYSNRSTRHGKWCLKPFTINLWERFFKI